MAEQKTTTNGVTIGAGVLTRDGSPLGSIKQVTSRSFKVDAPFHKDYWLPRDCITSCTDDAVVLGLPAASISEYQMDAPELDAAEDPFTTIGYKPLGEQELLEQRARMERELAEQSRQLPDHQPSITEQRGPMPYERIPSDHESFKEHAGRYVPNAPVQDQIEATLHTHARRGMARGLMLSIPITFGAAALGAIMLVRRRRHSAAAEVVGVRKQLHKSMHVARDEAKQCVSSVVHAATPVARSFLSRAKGRARRTMHAGLQAAAKQFE